MNNLTKTLLGSAALCALASAPALAQRAPNLNLTALCRGDVVNKTWTPARHREDCSRVCTGSTVSTYIPASDLGIQTNLFRTYYKWNSNQTICSNPKEKMKGQKRSLYGKVTHNTETYSLGCASGPTVFYGDAYTLTNPAGEGRTDKFVSKLIGTFHNGGTEYKGKLILDVQVSIGQ
jgi:hypothetical protein